ncbi:MAG: hypothetical protein ACYS32_01870 [Planctomycetota bacterium]
MSAQQNYRLCRICVCVLGLITILMPVSSAMAHLTDQYDITELVRDADFIFKGTVINVEYKNSEMVPLIHPNTGLQVIDESDGNTPVFVDGSGLPHTFVTFYVDVVHKGTKPEVCRTCDPNILTLRFEGGVSDETDPNTSIMLITGFPLFDVNDRAFLLVLDNTIKSCPVSHCDKGVFRIIEDPNELGINKIYSIRGERLLLVPNPTGPIPGEIGFGPYQELAGINENTLGPVTMIDAFAPLDTEPGDTNDVVPTELQFVESQFATYLDDVILAVHDPCELTGLPPVVSADINQLFFGLIVEPASPIEPNEPEVERPRPWLDLLDPEEKAEILEAERIELELLELTNGDPVLPSTPCELQILTEGLIPGDLSGPENKPDCRVNFYDVVVIGMNWLQCNDPDDPLCFN